MCASPPKSRDTIRLASSKRMRNARAILTAQGADRALSRRRDVDARSARCHDGSRRVVCNDARLMRGSAAARSDAGSCRRCVAKHQAQMCARCGCAVLAARRSGVCCSLWRAGGAACACCSLGAAVAYACACGGGALVEVSVGGFDACAQCFEACTRCSAWAAWQARSGGE